MKINFVTHSVEIKWFAYLGKIIATIFGVAFGIFYLVPAVQMSTNLDKTIIILMILICMLVFEVILHFALASFVQGLLGNEFRVIDVFGIILCGLVVGYVSIHSTEKGFTKNIKGLKNLDSLQNVQQNERGKILEDYQKQLQKLESISLPALQNLQTQNQWAYLSALKVFENNRSAINTEKNEALAKLEKAQKYTFSRMEISNLQVKEIHQKNQRQDAQNAKYFGLYALIFSIYSTLTIGTYRKKEALKEVQSVQNTPIQRIEEVLPIQHTIVQSTNQVSSEVLLVQSLSSEHNNNTQININISATPAETQKTDSDNKKVSLPVQQAKTFMSEGDFINDKTLTDKEKCLTIMEMFKISRGTYYRLKAEINKYN